MINNQQIQLNLTMITLTTIPIVQLLACQLLSQIVLIPYKFLHKDTDKYPKIRIIYHIHTDTNSGLKKQNMQKKKTK